MLMTLKSNDNMNKANHMQKQSTGETYATTEIAAVFAWFADSFFLGASSSFVSSSTGTSCCTLGCKQHEAASPNSTESKATFQAGSSYATPKLTILELLVQ